jgi:hypothetical protein
VIGVQIPFKSIFAGMHINMLGKKNQRPRVGTISNHVYFAIANEVKEFIFVTML